MQPASHGKGWANTSERADWFVFTNELDEHITRNSLYMCLKRAAKEIGVPELTVHDLRHNCATLMLENGTSIKTVSEHLGHSSITITGDIYAHVTPKMQAEAAEKMENVIKEIS